MGDVIAKTMAFGLTGLAFLMCVVLMCAPLKDRDGEE